MCEFTSLLTEHFDFCNLCMQSGRSSFLIQLVFFSFQGRLGLGNEDDCAAPQKVNCTDLLKFIYFVMTMNRLP